MFAGATPDRVTDPVDGLGGLTTWILLDCPLGPLTVIVPGLPLSVMFAETPNEDGVPFTAGDDPMLAIDHGACTLSVPRAEACTVDVPPLVRLTL
jgi:hypothetical protein